MFRSAKVLTRGGILLTALAATAWLLGPRPESLRKVLRDPQGVVDTDGPDAVLLVLAGLVLVLLCTWAAVVVLLAMISAVRPERGATSIWRRCAPSALRAPLAFLLGAGVLTMTACGQQATAPRAESSTPPAYVASSDVFDWPMTEPATQSPAPSGPVEAPVVEVSAEPSSPGAPPAGTIAVQPGSCLWSIASEQLGPGASTGEIAHLVDEIYAVNADVIGPDPDLLRPGTQLSLPPALPATT